MGVPPEGGISVLVDGGLVEKHERIDLGERVIGAFAVDVDRPHQPAQNRPRPGRGDDAGDLPAPPAPVVLLLSRHTSSGSDSASGRRRRPTKKERTVVGGEEDERQPEDSSSHCAHQ